MSSHRPGVRIAGVVAVVVVGGLTACGANPKQISDEGQSAQVPAMRTGQAGGLSAAALAEREAQEARRLASDSILYFDFDQDVLRSETRELLDAHARYLAQHPEARVRLEGHADERGSREYNVALGERRSQTVQRALLMRGARADQLALVSFGEERPAVVGRDEASHAANRRVEVRYQNTPIAALQAQQPARQLSRLHPEAMN